MLKGCLIYFKASHFAWCFSAVVILYSILNWKWNRFLLDSRHNHLFWDSIGDRMDILKLCLIKWWGFEVTRNQEFRYWSLNYLFCRDTLPCLNNECFFLLFLSSIFHLFSEIADLQHNFLSFKKCRHMLKDLLLKGFHSKSGSRFDFVWNWMFIPKLWHFCLIPLIAQI